MYSPVSLRPQTPHILGIPAQTFCPLVAICLATAAVTFLLVQATPHSQLQAAPTAHSIPAMRPVAAAAGGLFPSALGLRQSSALMRFHNLPLMAVREPIETSHIENALPSRINQHWPAAGYWGLGLVVVAVGAIFTLIRRIQQPPALALIAASGDTSTIKRRCVCQGRAMVRVICNCIPGCKHLIGSTSNFP